MKSPKPPRSTLTASDLRKVREIVRAESKEVRDEIKKLRKEILSGFLAGDLRNKEKK